jgi:hypothetical protein
MSSEVNSRVGSRGCVGISLFSLVSLVFMGQVSISSQTDHSRRHTGIFAHVARCHCDDRHIAAAAFFFMNVAMLGWQMPFAA